MDARIKSLRSILKLSQQQFGELIDCNRLLISRYENGESKPSYDIILKVAEKTNVNLNWLMMGEGAMFRDQSDRDVLELLKHENEFFKRKMQFILNEGLSSFTTDELKTNPVLVTIFEKKTDIVNQKTLKGRKNAKAVE